MQGPEAVADAVRLILEQQLPPRLRLLEARLAVTALPDPVRVIAQERGAIPLEDWPTLIVLPQGLAAMDLVEVNDDASETYRCRYPVEVLTWVRDVDYAATDTLRKRYALAIREVLLTRKSLAPAGELEVATAPSSIREDYSPVLTDTAGRTLAGVVTSVDVWAIEHLPGPTPDGQVAEFLIDETADTGTVQPHPALD